MQRTSTRATTSFERIGVDLDVKGDVGGPAVGNSCIPTSFPNDSRVGTLLIAVTIPIPGMPNMMMSMQHGAPGWTYNPSS